MALPLAAADQHPARRGQLHRQPVCRRVADRTDRQEAPDRTADAWCAPAALAHRPRPWHMSAASPAFISPRERQDPAPLEAATLAITFTVITAPTVLKADAGTRPALSCGPHPPRRPRARRNQRRSAHAGPTASRTNPLTATKDDDIVTQRTSPPPRRRTGAPSTGSRTPQPTWGSANGRPGPAAREVSGPPRVGTRHTTRGGTAPASHGWPRDRHPGSNLAATVAGTVHRLLRRVPVCSAPNPSDCRPWTRVRRPISP